MMIASSSLALAPLIPWPLFWLLTAAAMASLALGAWRRAGGIAIRAVAFAVLLALLANPSLDREQREPLSDIAVVIVDDSPSMGFAERDKAADAVRAHLLERMDRHDSLEVRVVRAGQRQQVAEEGTLPRDEGTRLFAPLQALLDEIPPRRFAGAIMITDGQVHDLPAVEGFSIPGPLHAVLVGDRHLRDRRLIVEQAPAFGIVGEEVTLTIRVEDNGLHAREAVDRASSVAIVLTRNGTDRREIHVRPGESVEIPVRLPHAGPNVFEIEAEALDGEVTLINNRLAVAVNGIRERLRVLLVSGLPHAGERVWRNLLKADPSVDLVHFTILRPPEKQDGTPVDELSLIAFPTRELFEEKLHEFDLIIFDRYHRRGVLPAVYLRNIVEYVERGGAILEAGGPAMATRLGLFHTTLGEILPIAPTGQMIEEGFTVRVSEKGRRHPVTARLPGSGPDPAEAGSEDPQGTAPRWGRWFRLVEATPRRGVVVMEDPQGRPVLGLDRVGEGRIAQLMSDQIWLWARGFEGGGPQAELLRRTAHWLMKEPELEESDLRAEIRGNRLLVTRQSLEPDERPVTVIAPSGSERTLALGDDGEGLATGSMEVEEQGLYRIVDAGETRTAFAAAGAINPLEFADVITTDRHLAPFVRASGGGMFWAVDGLPELRRPSPGRAMAGTGWLGLRAGGDHVVRGIERIPLAPPLLALVLALAALLWAWRREGR